MRGFLVGCVSVSLAAVAIGCGREPVPSRPPDVFVFLVDTLRTDRVGGPHGRMPFLDGWAARATVFDAAYAQASWTAPSVASLFTSRLPSEHGVVSWGSRLDDRELTLAEVLHRRGYATAAFVANGLISDKLGYAQGFDVFDALSPGQGADGEQAKVDGAVIGAAALRWIDALPKGPARPPLFVYLHYMEPHSPYAPPAAMLDRIAAGGPRPNIEDASAAMYFAAVYKPDAANLQNLQDVYDAEVLTVDDILREMFGQLASRGLLDDAIVVFTADHGEEFMEHGQLGHASSLYEELIHVPLLIAVPGQTARREVPDVVSLIDVAPTLTDMAGAPPLPSFDGRSLRGMLPQTSWWRRLASRFQPADPPRAALSELLGRADGVPATLPHQRAVVLGRRKLLVAPDGAQHQYDLDADPGEATPRATVDATLAMALDAFKVRVAPQPAGIAPAFAPDVTQRLKALGYVH